MYIYRSYYKNKLGGPFFGPPCRLEVETERACRFSAWAFWHSSKSHMMPVDGVGGFSSETVAADCRHLFLLKYTHILVLGSRLNANSRQQDIAFIMPFEYFSFRFKHYKKSQSNLGRAASPPLAQRMDSSAAYSSCAVLTVDESDHSAALTLHPHHSATFLLYVFIVSSATFPRNLLYSLGTTNCPSNGHVRGHVTNFKFLCLQS